MRRNLEDLVSKGERLEAVGIKSMEMREVAGKYKSQAKQLAWQALLKQYGAIVGLVLFFVFVLWWRFW